ncbi:MAG TPA: DUF3710 domain-containing protein [Streptosporangiaceae bacterium]|nr:DUF3710 domain-containing protein [Streptosporangiaceae bacterium]
MFRRRRREDADQGSPAYPDGAEGTEGAWADPGDQGAWDDDVPGAEAAASPGDPGVSGGPWDAGEAFPERERADFGSLLVPIVPTQQIEMATDGQRFIWVTVRSGGSELRVHAFAAPRSGGLWEDVRQEIVAELSSAGPAAQETGGPFGPEIFAHVPVEPGAPSAETRPVRFIGVDGPRWLLRGLIIGPAAVGQEPAEPFEEIFSDIVVVRGDHPMPPRDMLELRLPPEVQQELEQQAAAEQAGQETGNRFQTDLNPFDRGPEFTETR